MTMQPGYRFTRAMIRAFATVWFRISVHGRENVPVEGPVLLVSNHASHLDPPLIAVGSPRQCCFLAKEELFRVPLLSWFIRSIGGAKPIRRAAMDREALRTCKEILESGSLLVVFPEGTRTPDGKLQPGKPGITAIAKAGNAVLVPTYVDGTFNALPRGCPFPRPVHVGIHFGKPFRLEFKREAGGSSHDMHEAATREIMERIAEVERSARQA